MKKFLSIALFVCATFTISTLSPAVKAQDKEKEAKEAKLKAAEKAKKLAAFKDVIEPIPWPGGRSNAGSWSRPRWRGREAWPGRGYRARLVLC